MWVEKLAGELELLLPAGGGARKKSVILFSILFFDPVVDPEHSRQWPLHTYVMRVIT